MTDTGCLILKIDCTLYGVCKSDLSGLKTNAAVQKQSEYNQSNVKGKARVQSSL